MRTDLDDLLARAQQRYFAGHLNEAVALLKQRIEAADFLSLPDRDQSELRLQLGRLLATAIFMDGANPVLAREQLDLARTKGDARQRAASADLMGLTRYYEQLARERADCAEAQVEFEAALRAREAWADSRELSESHFHLGMVAQLTGDGETAMDRFRRSYELAKQGGHKIEQSFAIRHIGFLRRGLGDVQGAYEAMAESLRLREEVGLIVYLPFSHLTLAEAALALERVEESERHFRLAHEIATRTGNKRAQLLSELGLGRLHRAEERWAAARTHFTNALGLAEQIGHQIAAGEARDALRSLPEGPA
jgi:tetratricopeptide (TPR) repeat protein